MAPIANSVRPLVGRWIFFALLAAGAVASLVSSAEVASQVSGMNDVFPWGLMMVLNVVCGLSVSAGAFTTAMLAHVVNDRTWRPIVRPSMLIGFAAYAVAVLGAIGNLQQPARIWSVIVRLPGSRSPLVGCVWTIALLSSWMYIEFADTARLSPRIRRAILWLIAAAMVLVTNRQQWFIASLLVDTGSRMSPQWSGGNVPMLFLVSSLGVGAAVLLFVLTRSEESPASTPIFARVLSVTLLLYLMLRLDDVAERGALRSSLDPAVAIYFWPEIALLFVAMVWLAEPQLSSRSMYVGSAMAILGTLVHRVNTCITAFGLSAQTSYHPHWTEMSVAYSLIAVGVGIYVAGAKWLLHEPITPTY